MQPNALALLIAAVKAGFKAMACDARRCYNARFSSVRPPEMYHDRGGAIRGIGADAL